MNNNMPPRLNIIMAHRREATGLISKLKLKQQCVKPFHIYENDESKIRLVISGQGKTRMAAAVAHLSEPDSIFINLGIAGHKDAPLGELFAVSKLSQLQGRQFYPKFSTKELPHCALTSVDVPEENYRSAMLYDMEAWAFYDIASLYTTHEKIYVYKMVSDNSEQPLTAVTIPKAHVLMERHATRLAEICLQHQKELTIEHETYYSEYAAALLNRVHFTSYQQHRLLELMRRAVALNYADSIIKQVMLLSDAKMILAKVENLLDVKQFTYSWE